MINNWSNQSGDNINRLIYQLRYGRELPARVLAAEALGSIENAAQDIIDALTVVSRDVVYVGLANVCQSALRRIEARKMEARKGTSRRDASVTVKRHRMAVAVTEDQTPGLLVSGSASFRKCNFCDKQTPQSAMTNLACQLSGPGQFYCPFCLRHRLNEKNTQHVLILTFRGVIGYYFYAFYHHLPKPLMYVNEIMDYVNLHVEMGTQNPVFLYDPETFLWFIDFSRVGSGKRKVHIQDILKTITEIIFAFNLHECVKDIKISKFYHRYEEAVFKFYHQRHRPVGLRILAPTLAKTGASEFSAEKATTTVMPHVVGTVGTTTTSYERRRIVFEETRTFTPALLKESLERR
jgi:hypothetical protein